MTTIEQRDQGDEDDGVRKAFWAEVAKRYRVERGRSREPAAIYPSMVARMRRAIEAAQGGVS